MSVMEEPLIAELVFAEAADMPALAGSAAAYLRNEQEVWAHNLQAMRVDPDALTAFLELLAGADAEYMDTEGYLADPAVPGTLVDWESVSAALSESQQILITVQKLLSDALADMGVEDHASVRVYADEAGLLHLITEHPRQTEIEAILNSPAYAAFRALYGAATSGMSMAGGMVGRLSVPDGVLEGNATGAA